MCSLCAPQAVTDDENGPGGSPVSVRRLPGPMLRRRAARQPTGMPYPGCSEYHPTCSYADLDLRARAVAARLGVLLPPGSRVMLAYPPGTDLAGALYGCLYAGMTAVPFVPLGPAGADPSGAAVAVKHAAERTKVHAVLTGGDSLKSLGLDRRRTPVVEADGYRVGGDPLWRLAESWQPVGVLRTADAYQRYVPDGTLGGRLEPSIRHGDLGVVLAELAHAARLGTSQESVGWIAAVHGIEEAVWRILLPVHC
jgi:hypothetical protein